MCATETIVRSSGHATVTVNAAEGASRISAIHTHLVVDADAAAENDRLRLSPQLS